MDERAKSTGLSASDNAYWLCGCTIFILSKSCFNHLEIMKEALIPRSDILYGVYIAERWEQTVSSTRTGK